jgi:hypothetical protein
MNFEHLNDSLLEIPILSPSEQAQLDKLDENQRKILLISRTFMRYCKNNLKIKTKDGRLVELDPHDWPAQLIIIKATIKKILDGEPIRFIILKARQEGVSTIVEALIFWWTSTHKYIQSKIIAHDSDTSEKLYSMFRTYYDNANPLFQPTTKYNTRSDLTFDNEANPEKGLNSQIDTATAENAGSGRGSTIQWLHGSEVAKWRNGRELVAGLMQAVPLMANTAIFLESTANGIGDYFHLTWQAAKRGEGAFTPLFFPWNIHPEYKMAVPKGFRCTEEEKKLKVEFELTDEQLVWRRAKMREFVGDEKRFYQEYPLTDAEAFLASGSPRFNITKLMEMEQKCYDPKFVDLSEKREILKETEFIAKEIEGAPLKVWFKPNYAHEYVIGVDVAEGVGEDFSVATVMDKEGQRTVARFRGDLEPSAFGEYLDILGRYYNNALIGVEINNHGLTVVQRLRDIGYMNLYRRESGMDERYEEYTSKLGWRTDVRTKPLMIDALSEAISDERIVDFDKIFIREAMTYVRDDRGRTNAQEGQHDDTVMSTAICLQLFEWNPINQRKMLIRSRLPQKARDQHQINAGRMKMKPASNRH